MKIIIMAALFALLGNAYAQKIVEKHIDFANKKGVSLNIQITDSILIQTWKKNEVYARASININENKDNEVYETTFSEADSKVMIKANFRSDYFKGKNRCCESEIAWTIYIPENAEISAETINGNIIINGLTSKIKAHTISGFIDLGVPVSKKADLEFKTISGNIYTDHTFAVTAKKRFAELKVIDRINGGGVPINLETISGDIFFRKSK